jgi:GAF domain-containing protein
MSNAVGEHGLILNLDEVLHDLAEPASQVVPGNHGAGATLVQDGVSVYRSSNSFTQQVDRSQYWVGEGPCISAVNEATTMVSGTIKAGEERWPRFRDSVSALPVHSVMSLPLTVAGRAIGSINVYSSTPGAFTDTRQRHQG